MTTVGCAPGDYTTSQYVVYIFCASGLSVEGAETTEKVCHEWWSDDALLRVEYGPEGGVESILVAPGIPVPRPTFLQRVGGWLGL